MSDRAKYLINCQEGANHPERATISFILATSAAKTAEAAVFVTSDASELCTRGGADGIQAAGMEPLADLMDQFVNHGGRIWLCPICAKVHGIGEADLRDGVEIAGAPRTMDYIASGAKLLA